MTHKDMDYLLSRLGQAFIAAGNTLLSNSGNVPSAPTTTPSESNASPSDTPDPVLDNSPALGEVAVIANRAPLRSEPTKSIDVDLGRLLEGERAPLDRISDDKKWYRMDVRNFAGMHTVPDDAQYAWGEASNFEIIKLS
jgi:hypothetical protein